MSAKLLRLVYVCEFLVANVAVYAAWSEIGGQAALDLMHWALKLALGVGLAGAFVAYSAALVEGDSIWTLRSMRWLTAIVLLIGAMGFVTYFYAAQADAGDSDETAPVHHAISAFLRTS